MRLWIKSMFYVLFVAKTNGTITKYEIQVSEDGENFRTVASGDW